jgi:putative transposase
LRRWGFGYQSEHPDSILRGDRQNPYVERMIGTLRRELLDHVIVLNQRHLERLLREFIQDYYHPARPHQGLAGETPRPQAPPGKGELISVPVVGGLHHRYYRAAA